MVGDLAVDPGYYADRPFSRGDVIYFRTPAIPDAANPSLKPAARQIARVIGLPGEKVKIEHGQIYIDDKRLDSFYGHAQSRGLDQEAYANAVGEADVTHDMEAYFDPTIEELAIPGDHVYVLGDMWWRSVDSRLFGPLSTPEIRGKVVGYVGGSYVNGKQSE